VRLERLFESRRVILRATRSTKVILERNHLVAGVRGQPPVVKVLSISVVF